MGGVCVLVLCIFFACLLVCSGGVCCCCFAFGFVLGVLGFFVLIWVFFACCLDGVFCGGFFCGSFCGGFLCLWFVWVVLLLLLGVVFFSPYKIILKQN